MKPYLRVIYNDIKLLWIKLIRQKVFFYPVQLWGWNTKIKMQRGASIQLGKHITSDGRCVIIIDQDADLSIGDGVYFNEGAMISCKASVKIGAGCKFGPNVKIFDNDHKFDAENGVGNEHIMKPISIGQNCWIASNCIVLKGTTIGDNCVIGAGVIVHGKIPDSSIVTASRDICIRPIEEKEE